MKNWKFASFIEVDKEFRVEGLNIWNHYWHCYDRNVEVLHPTKHHQYRFKEYEIQTPEKSVISDMWQRGFDDDVLNYVLRFNFFIQVL